MATVDLQMNKDQFYMKDQFIATELRDSLNNLSNVIFTLAFQYPVFMLLRLALFLFVRIFMCGCSCIDTEAKELIESPD